MLLVRSSSNSWMVRFVKHRHINEVCKRSFQRRVNRQHVYHLVGLLVFGNTVEILFSPCNMVTEQITFYWQ